MRDTDDRSWHWAIQRQRERLSNGQALIEHRTGTLHDYGRKERIDHTEVMLPAGAPAWAEDSSALWNGLEKHERRSDAQLAREATVAMSSFRTHRLNSERSRRRWRLFSPRQARRCSRSRSGRGAARVTWRSAPVDAAADAEQARSELEVLAEDNILKRAQAVTLKWANARRHADHDRGRRDKRGHD